MWLSGLHIPESYLTALVQATCRKNSWPLDKSTLYTAVTHYQTGEDVTERAHHGGYSVCVCAMRWPYSRIYGLFICNRLTLIIAKEIHLLFEIYIFSPRKLTCILPRQQGFLTK